MDRLEEHIRKNREAMDHYRPSPGVWKKIRRTIQKKKSAVQQWLSVAAMITVVLGTALVLFRIGYFVSDERSDRKAGARIQENSQLKESEMYYSNLMNSLILEATPLLTANPDIEKELETDISHLDSICVEIKKDLRDNIANQEVVEALIQNYRTKIRLLEDMLKILKEDENDPEKKESYEL
jgi:hypothetical protein